MAGISHPLQRRHACLTMAIRLEALKPAAQRDLSPENLANRAKVLYKELTEDWSKP